VLEPLLNRPGKPGRKHGADLRRVVDGMLYVAHTGCQWRFLPVEFGPWTRVWSQFRRWAANGMWEQVMRALHERARQGHGRAEAQPSMIVIDSHLARGASNGGATFHNRGGPYGMTNGAKRVVAVDVTGLPVAARVVPASTPEASTVELLIGDLVRAGQADRLELVLVDRGTSAKAAARVGKRFGVEVRRVGWDEPQRDDHGRKVFRPIRFAWRVEVAHGLLGRRRRLARSFENTCRSGTAWLQVACVSVLLGAIVTAPAGTNAAAA
jgi:putative transposase